MSLPKAILKRAVKAALATAGRECLDAADSRILTYHSVGFRDHEMNVHPEMFARQMTWLAQNRKVITLDEAAELKPGVAVSFDDGYRDNLVHAAPVLRALDIPATVFVVAGRVGGLLEHDRDRETAALLTWEEIREIEAMGCAIGAHGLTHRRLALLDAEEQREEVATCSKRLEEQLGHPVHAFAYPFGSAADYTSETTRLVRESGFRYAVSNRYGRNTRETDRWTLRRIWVDATDSLNAFQAKVDGRLDPLALLESRAGLRARRVLNRCLRTH